MDFELDKNGEVSYWLECYQQYLSRVRGLALQSQRSYLFIAKRFFEDIAKDGLLQPSMFNADTVLAFVTKDAGPRSGRGQWTTTSATRSLLRFLVSQQTVLPQLVFAVPRFRQKAAQIPPSRLSQEDLERVHYFIDHSANAKERALLLIFLRFGLRANEVSMLMLDHFDWSGGWFTVSGRKTRTERRLPLPSDVAEGLIGYLRGRPETSQREIFVGDRPPFNPHSADAIAKIVRRALRKAGVHRSHMGTHVFRHTMASQMVNQGVSFKEVSDLLGHRSLKATSVYAKLDLNSLSRVALAWPGDDA